MEIENFDIKVKKYDKSKNVVYVNVIACGVLEIRGYVVRYTETRHSHGVPVWIVSPPSIRMKNKKYFWIVQMKDSEIWEKLQEVIIDKVKEYTSAI